MTLRRVLFGLAALATGVLIGLPVADLFRPETSAETLSPSDIQPEAAPTATAPVELGPSTDAPALVVEEAPDWEAFSHQTRSVAAHVSSSVVFVCVNKLTNPGGNSCEESGSGVILTPQGDVLTNAHVLEAGGRVTVTLTDKREYRAEVVGVDETTDLAVIRLLEVGIGGDLPLPVATLGDSDEVEVGDWVLAIGNPFALINTVTQGIISATGRPTGSIRSDFAIEDFIQTDAAINQGSSGGALVSFRGEVIGIVTAIASNTGNYEGYGFAVPSNLARRVATDLITYGRIRRGYLGIEVQAVTTADAREQGLDRARGVLVVDVARGGVAARAGIRRGDVLLAVGGRPVNEINVFQSRLAQRGPGDAVQLTIWRDGQQVDYRAALVEKSDPALSEWIARATPAPTPVPQPEGPVQRSEAADWGVQFRDLSPSERRSFEVSAGAFVEAIDANSSAELDGLPLGTVVIAVEGRAVASAEEARLALARLARRDVSALLRVRRPDGLTAFYDLAPPFAE